MDWKNYLFSFDGRLNRAKYWLFVLIGTIYTALLVAIAFAVGIVQMPTVAMIVLAVLYLFLIYSGVAVGIKRLHDRDKSGWWLLLFYVAPAALDVGGRFTNADSAPMAQLALSLVSLVLAVWGLIELGIRRGTRGPNQYGPDPLQGRA